MTSAKPETPRGVRNANPGNLENTQPWQGLAPKEMQTDGRFAVFNGPAWGIRAIAVTLITYQDKHRIRSVRDIINRWAPPTENDSVAYINQVAKAVGVRPDAMLDVHQYHVMKPLVEAIIRHENGAGPLATPNTWYDEATIDEGLRLAGVIYVPKSVVATKEGLATGAAAAAGGTALIGELVSQVTPLMTQVKSATEMTNGLPTWLRTAIVAMTMLAVCASVYVFLRKRKVVAAVQS